MKKRIHIAFVATAMVALGSLPAQAVNLLTGGDFEVVGGEIPGWTLEEFATGSGTILNTAEIKDWSVAVNSGSLGLWLRAFEGGRDTGPDNLTNAVLWQTVPAVVGELYTFSGHVAFEGNYSGNMDWLPALATGDPADVGPLAGQPSPTRTNLELVFLNAGGDVIGTPTTIELGPIVNVFTFFEQHSVSAVAPSGSAHVRVTAQARDMVFNIDPAQSAFYDDFSLTGAASPATQLLANPDLEDLPPTPLDSWTVTNDDPEDPANDEIIRTAGFANHTPDGGTGIWLSSFFGEAGTEVDGTLSQTVAGLEDGNYTFSGWSRWETFYSGGLDGSVTETFLELAFLDGTDAVIGDPISLDLRDEQMNDGEWRQHTLNGVAPAGTASVRVTAGMTDGFDGGANPQSAFFDDFVLELAAAFDADFDEDGDVDGDDFLLWQGGFGNFDGDATKMDGDADNDGDVDGDDFLAWQDEFGSGDGAGSTAVPEPASALLALLAAGLLAIARRRST